MIAVHEDATETAEAPQPVDPDTEQRVSWWRMLLSGASWALLVAMIALAAAVIVVPAVTGAKTYTVLTGSMEPTYPPGTLVVVRPVAPDELSMGDVITFQLRSGEAQVATHRIVGVGADATGEPLFVTRGDANNVDDEDPVRPVQVIGKLWYAVPYIGWVNNVINGSARAWAIPIAAVGLFVYGAVMVLHAARERRRGSRAARAEA